MSEITKAVEKRYYKKGEIVFNEGDKSDRLYLITKGKMKVYRFTKEGKEQIIYLMSEGEFIGDLNLIQEDVFSFSATAIENLEVCILKKEDFDKLIYERPEISMKIMQSMYQRVKILENLVQRLGSKDIEERIAGLLLSLIKNFGKPIEKRVELKIPLSREELASIIGSTRETVSRKLSLLQDEGIIDIVGGKKIVILKLEELEDKVE